MKVQTGYLYHIKDEFFDIVNDENLMTNHERGKKRPTYFTIKDKDILWFIEDFKAEPICVEWNDLSIYKRF